MIFNALRSFSYLLFAVFIAHLLAYLMHSRGGKALAEVCLLRMLHFHLTDRNFHSASPNIKST